MLEKRWFELGETGLKINLDKTKVMHDEKEIISINTNKIEHVAQ